MSAPRNAKAGNALQLVKQASPSSNDNHQKAIRVYFRPDYTGSVHLILGSFVVETTGSVEEALERARSYLPAAKRCGKPIELVPVDSTYQTTMLTIDEWLA